MGTRTVITCHSCGTKNGVHPSATARPRCRQCRAALAWVVDADASTFADETTAAMPVLVDFWATWCGPCRMVAPALESLARKFAGSLKVVRVDIDRAPEPAQRFEVRSVPSLVLLRDGDEVDRQVGALPERTLEQWLVRQGVAEAAKASTAPSQAA